MQPWAVEYGTLWAWERGDGLPPVCQAGVEVEFKEVGPADIADLAVAMDLPTAELIQQRLQTGRRCFSLRVDGRIVTYGWVTHGVECVGELDRQFNLADDEAYIWHCGTLPAWRRQHCYSALLSQIINQLHGEGIPRLWIGASRQNRPSVQGFVNAGFQHVIDVTYRRFHRLTLLWLHQRPTPRHPLVWAAYHILLNDRERRLGQLAIGYKHE